MTRNQVQWTFLKVVTAAVVTAYYTALPGDGMPNFVLERYPALKFARYRRYWLASFASVGATQLITLGQGWLIFELSGSALQLGVLGAAAALPNIVMTLIGGVVADRFDKRMILMCTSGVITVLLALLAWLDYSGTVQVWHVLTIAALFSLVTGLDWPVRVSIYPQLVDRSAFMSAVALNSFIWQVTRMAIPAAGGVLIALTDTWVVFALASAGFLVMLIVISGIHVPVSRLAEASAIEQVTEGLRFIWTQDLFRALIALTFVGMFFANSYVQLMPVFANLLDSGETGFGYLLSAGGVGSVLGTLLMGGVHKYARLGLVLLGAAAASMITLMLFAVFATSGWFYPALLMTFLTSVFAAVFMISSMTVLQLTVPDELRGRVMGIHTMGFSFMPLGGLFLGSMTEATNAATALIVGCSIFLLAIAIVGWWSASVRDLDGTVLGEHASVP
jgi:MFS family permease